MVNTKATTNTPKKEKVLKTKDIKPTKFTIYTGKPIFIEEYFENVLPDSEKPIGKGIDISYSYIDTVSHKLDNYLRQAMFKNDDDFNRVIINLDNDVGIVVYGFSYSDSIREIKLSRRGIQRSVQALFYILMNSNGFITIHDADCQLFHTEYELFIKTLIEFAEFSNCKVNLTTDNLEFIKAVVKNEEHLTKSDWSLIQLEFNSECGPYSYDGVKKTVISYDDFKYRLENNIDIR